MTATKTDIPTRSSVDPSPGRGTLPSLVLAQAQQRPKAVALRKKDKGIWRELTWQDYFEAMRAVGLALNASGVNPGDSVGIIAENEPAWLFADLGAQSVGALSVAAYPTQVADDVVYIMEHAACKVIFCGDQEQVDKIYDNRASLPNLQRVVVFDMKGVVGYDDKLIVSFADFVASGAAVHTASSRKFSDLLGGITADDVALVGYTSGTTGKPKGAMLRHRDQVAMATAFVDRIEMRPKDRDFCHFPLCHPAVRVMDAYTSLVAGNSVNFPESPETVSADIAELSPTFILGTPRVFEVMKADVEIRVNRASWIKRKAFGWSRSTLATVLDRKLAGKSRAYDPVLRFGADLLAARWVRERLGLGSLRYASCGGASVSPELLKFFWSFGIPLYETYGQSETSGVAFGQKSLADLGTAGWIMPCIESKLSDEGELLLRGDGIFIGYLHDPDNTAAALLTDGWYRTGDVGYFDKDGRLIITDRQKHVITSSAATTGMLSPSEIENHLRLSPYISDAMVVGANRPYLTALVQIEYESVAEWAQRHNLPFTTFRSLTLNVEVQTLIRNEVARTNMHLPSEKKVAAHRLLPRELDPDTGEVTPTRKIKRDVVADRFDELIEEMYRAETSSSSTALPTG